jgi:hypothetical protein
MLRQAAQIVAAAKVGSSAPEVCRTSSFFSLGSTSLIFFFLSIDFLFVAELFPPWSAGFSAFFPESLKGCGILDNAARHTEHRRASPQAPRRCRNRRRIIPGQIHPRLLLSQQSLRFGGRPPTWSLYASLPGNPCSRSPLPRTGDLPRAQTTRKAAHALRWPGNPVREQLRPIRTGIREPRFNATFGVQLLGHLNLSQLSNRLLGNREYVCVFLTIGEQFGRGSCSPPAVAQLTRAQRETNSAERHDEHRIGSASIAPRESQPLQNNLPDSVKTSGCSLK